MLPLLPLRAAVVCLCILPCLLLRAPCVPLHAPLSACACSLSCHLLPFLVTASLLPICFYSLLYTSFFLHACLNMSPITPAIFHLWAHFTAACALCVRLFVHCNVGHCQCVNLLNCVLSSCVHSICACYSVSLPQYILLHYVPGCVSVIR